MLRALEEAGRIRRGYFVAGLGAAQFALAGALDRLRSARDQNAATGDAPDIHLLAAADPANPYGAAVPWPRRGETDKRPFQRAAGAYVVLVDGVAALYLDRGGSSLQTLPAFDDPLVATAALGALRGLLGDSSRRELVVSRVDGEPVGRSPWYETLLKAGFIQGYRGVVMRRDRIGAMIA
jgi:ATP-dependent Lhr-like helicase